jgi:hypothetical protein
MNGFCFQVFHTRVGRYLCAVAAVYEAFNFECRGVSAPDVRVGVHNASGDFHDVAECFVRTQSGYLGIASRHARPGDKIVLPVRSPLTFILRDLISRSVPLDQKDVSEMAMSSHVLFGPYELIGNVYVHALDFASYDTFTPKPLLVY